MPLDLEGLTEGWRSSKEGLDPLREGMKHCSPALISKVLKDYGLSDSTDSLFLQNPKTPTPKPQPRNPKNSE